MVLQTKTKFDFFGGENDDIEKKVLKKKGIASYPITTKMCPLALHRGTGPWDKLTTSISIVSTCDTKWRPRAIFEF